MPFYYDLTSVNIFCHLVVRMSSPFIIAVIHQCVCVCVCHLFMIHLHSWLFHPPPNSWIWVIVGRIPLLTYLWEWGHVTSKYVTQIIHHLSWSFTCFHQLSSFTIIADIFYHLVSSCVILHDFVSCLSYSIIRFHSSATRLHLVPCISCYPSFISNPSLTMMLHQRKKQGANPHGHLHAKTKTAQLHCMTFCSGFRKRNLPLCSPLHLGSRRMLMSNAKSGVMSAQHSMSYASQQTNINHFTLNSRSWSTITKFCKHCKTCGCPRQELRQHLKHIPQERWDRCLAGLLLQSNPPRKM